MQEPTKPNVASAPERAQLARERIPMSVPQLKLEAPEIPGVHCHWMLGTPQRLNQAQRAGYVFVEPDEVEINYRGLADDPGIGGNTDMGMRSRAVWARSGAEATLGLVGSCIIPLLRSTAYNSNRATPSRLCIQTFR